MAETVDLTGGGLQLDPNILLLLQALTSNSPSTNQNFAQDLFSPQANSYALGAFLGLQDMSELEQAVMAAAYTPVPDSVYTNMDYESLENQAVSSGDEVLLDAFARIKAGASPEEITNELKSTYLATNEQVKPSSREYKAFELGVEAKKGVLEEYQSRWDSFLDFNDQVQRGEIVQREGRDFFVTSEGDRNSELADKGIYGVLANPDSYVTERDRQLQAAQEFLAQSQKEEATKRNELFDQFVKDQRMTTEQEDAIAKILEGGKDKNVGDYIAYGIGATPGLNTAYYGAKALGNTGQWVWNALGQIAGAVTGDGAHQQAQARAQTKNFNEAMGDWLKAIPLVGNAKVLTDGVGRPTIRTEEDRKRAEEAAARYGWSASMKNAQEALAAQKAERDSFTNLQRSNAERISSMLDSAEKADDTVTAASNDLNQRAQMMSLLAANNANSSGSSGGGGGGSYKPTVSLTDEEINKIVSSLVRR